MSTNKVVADIPFRVGPGGFVIEGLCKWVEAMGGTPHINFVAGWPTNQIPDGLHVQRQPIHSPDDNSQLELPMIVMNIGSDAVRGLEFVKNDDGVVTQLLFSGRVNGVHFDATIDVNSILAVFMLEDIGRGMSLGNNPELDKFMTALVNGISIEEASRPNPKPKGKPTLSVVK